MKKHATRTVCVSHALVLIYPFFRMPHIPEAHLLAAQLGAPVSHLAIGLRLAKVDISRSTPADPHLGHAAFSFIL